MSSYCQICLTVSVPTQSVFSLILINCPCTQQRLILHFYSRLHSLIAIQACCSNSFPFLHYHYTSQQLLTAITVFSLKHFILLPAHLCLTDCSLKFPWLFSSSFPELSPWIALFFFLYIFTPLVILFSVMALNNHLFFHDYQMFISILDLSPDLQTSDVVTYLISLECLINMLKLNALIFQIPKFSSPTIFSLLITTSSLQFLRPNILESSFIFFLSVKLYI